MYLLIVTRLLTDVIPSCRNGCCLFDHCDFTVWSFRSIYRLLWSM